MVHSSSHDKRRQKKIGRTKNGVEELDRMMYSIGGTVAEKTSAIERFRKEAGCFVLLTNVREEGEDGYKAKYILNAYKDQHGIERNFGFLRDPVIVNSIFLKKPGIGKSLIIAISFSFRSVFIMYCSIIAKKNATVATMSFATRCALSICLTTRSDIPETASQMVSNLDSSSSDTLSGRCVSPVSGSYG